MDLELYTIADLELYTIESFPTLWFINFNNSDMFSKAQMRMRNSRVIYGERARPRTDINFIVRDEGRGFTSMSRWCCLYGWYKSVA